MVLLHKRSRVVGSSFVWFEEGEAQVDLLWSLEISISISKLTVAQIKNFVPQTFDTNSVGN